MSAADADQGSIAAAVLAALEGNQLELPTLPDMALKIRDLIDDPNVSAERIVHLLSADPVISGQIIKAANSAAYSSGNPVGNLQGAISRLGYRMLRSMVMSITMTRLFEAGSPRISQQLKKLWEHSREVAANSYVLARQQAHLNPEQAMLAGLVHDIGALPLYIYAERHDAHLDEATLGRLIRKFAAPVGTRLLQSWNFPQDLVEVVSGHENLQRANDSGIADYVDVVTVANMQMQGTAKFVAWENVSAAARLGFSPADCRNFLSSHADQLAAVKGMLGVDAAPPAKPAAPAAAPKAAQPPARQPAQQNGPGLLSGLAGLFKWRNPK